MEACALEVLPRPRRRAGQGRRGERRRVWGLAVLTVLWVSSVAASSPHVPGPLSLWRTPLAPSPPRSAPPCSDSAHLPSDLGRCLLPPGEQLHWQRGRGSCPATTPATEPQQLVGAEPGRSRSRDSCWKSGNTSPSQRPTRAGPVQLLSHFSEVEKEVQRARDSPRRPSESGQRQR